MPTLIDYTRSIVVGDRWPSAPQARQLRFADYANQLPAPPDALHWSPAAGDWAKLEDIYGNGTLGDCTSAGAGHTECIWRGAAKNSARLPTRADVIQFYSRSTGYVPGHPSTDQGGDLVTVMNVWKNQGFFSDGTGKIAAWVAVDGSNETEIKQALWLSESLYFGVGLPDAWINPFPGGNGFVWDIAGSADQNNGHCFIGIGYNAHGVTVDSWGLFGTITWAAIKAYATASAQGELYCLFSQDAINAAQQKAPNGFAWDQLLADSASL